MKEPLADLDFIEAANLLNCEVAAIRAVAEVESGPRGGFCPDGFPVTLFEGHIFFKYTKGIYALNHPTICYPRWTKEFYGKTWTDERLRLEEATKLDRRAALMSASWGRFQIMGFNYPLVGCTHIQQFVNLMCKGEHEQLDLTCQYLIHTRLDKALREGRFEDFVEVYNGPGWRKNDYLGKFYRAYKRHGGVL